MLKKLLAVVVLSSAALAPACSSEDPADAADADVVEVAVSSNQFEPASVKIKVGQTVRWTWRGGSHNIRSGPDCDQPDDKFGASIRSGGTFEKKFEVAGSFPYYCEPHCSMGMKGEIIVE
jgi:plastocyanin